MAKAPLGAQACTLDIEGAYRTVPVMPDHKRFIVVYFEGFLYLDHNVPFGLGSASGIQGEIADATVDIWYSLDVHPVVKWVDDFTIFRFPRPEGPFSEGSFDYAYDLNSVKHMISPLGVPWHPTKGQDFASSFSYIGFEWNLTTKSVQLSSEKRAKHIAKVSAFILQSHSRPFTKKEVESINGSLAHISFVYLRGRSHLCNLTQWLTTFVDSFKTRYPPPSVITDLKWWLNILSAPSFIRPLIARPTTTDLNIWVDASTSWGIGILIDGLWDAWRTAPGWKKDGRDIGWLEAIAVEVIIIILHASNIKNQDILVRSDNMGVIGAFNRGRSHNRPSNEAIQRSEILLDDSDISISFQYVESASNLADPISRGILPSYDYHLPILYKLPSPIASFFLPP